MPAIDKVKLDVNRSTKNSDVSKKNARNAPIDTFNHIIRKSMNSNSKIKGISPAIFLPSKNNANGTVEKRIIIFIN